MIPWLRLASLSLALVPAVLAAEASTFPVAIQVDAGREIGDVAPVWRCFGADEPNYATMKDGRRLLGELGALRPDHVYFRAHNLLCTGDGTPAPKWGSTNIYTEDAQGRPVYDWSVVDRIFDTYRAHGVRPYVEIGFMPEALSVHPAPYQHEWRAGRSAHTLATGWSYPPKDYAKWAELVYQWAHHCVERYGAAEVATWYWEVWNEPNLDLYWNGTPEEFFRLHDTAVAAVRRALPNARVGGPDVAGAGGAFMDAFLQHVTTGTNYATGETGTPTDFLSFHAKGQPAFVDGHVRLGIAAQLNGIAEGFAKIAAVPALRGKPIIIGESDPDACAACQGPALGYRTGTMYASYTAATFGRLQALADRAGVQLDSALTWAFEFEDQPYFAGQRVLATNGIDLPVLNAFRLFSRLSGRRLAVASDGAVPLDRILRDGVRGAPDVSAIASRDGRTVSVLAWHYHDDDVAGPDATVDLALTGLPGNDGPAHLTRYAIDGTHSNAFAAWQRLGSPATPDDDQYAALVRAGGLETAGDVPATVDVAGHAAHLHVTLPRQSVTLLVLTLD